MKYAISRYKKEQMDMAYAIYMSDTFYYNNHQKMIDTRFIDIIQPKHDDVSGDEIVANIIKSADLRIKE